MMVELALSIEARVLELDESLELSLDQIFDTVCLEYHLNPYAIAQRLGCKCPFVLIGFIAALELAEVSSYQFSFE